jgi:cytochrome P450
MNLPDGPKTPAFFQTLNWIIRPLQTLEHRAKRYGDTFRIFGNKVPPYIYFSNPEALKVILTAPEEQIGYVDAAKIFKPLVGENSLLVLTGTSHQRQRQLLMPPFHGERMRTYGQTICNITTEVISQVPLEQCFAVRPIMQDITLSIMLKTIFGLSKGGRYDEIKRLLLSLLNLFSSPLNSVFLFLPALQKDWGVLSPWGRLLQLKQHIDKILIAEIQERRKQLDYNHDDILTLLLGARDEVGQAMTDDELKDELITLLFAGYENTASALAWALYSINSLTTVKAKLLSEIDTIKPDFKPSAIAQMPYLNAICQETLRLYPITLSGFPRLVKQHIRLMGYELEPGTVLIASIYLVHQREDLYPNPKQFKPERFLERQFSPYEFFPFGGGSRRCIGSAFAQYEMKLVLATIMSRWNLKLVHHSPIKPVRLGLNLAPPKHLRLVVTGVR